jgi:hypothetical protein
MGAHPPAAVDLRLVERARSLRRGIRAHLLERPDEVHGCGTRVREHPVCSVEVLVACRCERIGVCGGDADRRRAANSERPDRVGDLGRGRAPELDFLVRKPALVEEDDRTGFQTNDSLGA